MPTLFVSHLPPHRHEPNALLKTHFTPNSPAAPVGTSIVREETDDSRWFYDEVHPHDAKLKAYLRASFPTIRDIEDVVQESYLRLWKARAAQPVVCAAAFLFTVARRLAIDLIRRKQRSIVDSVGDCSRVSVVDEKSNLLDAEHMQHKIRLLADAVERLPARCRKVVVLRKIEGVPTKEIARRLGLSVKTVESHFTRGMKLCEVYLREQEVHGLFFDESR